MTWEMMWNSFYFMLPAYFANMAPIFVQNHLKFLAKPLDFGKSFQGKRILGDNKTFRGLVFGLLLGMLVFFLQKHIGYYSLVDYNVSGYELGFLLSFGALFGDSVKSFFKRRAGIMPGKPWIPFDQIDFVIGSVVFASLVYVPSILELLWISIVSIAMHFLTNYLGYLLKMRPAKF